ncbi:hypothetical protein E5288_WYG015470 [Bos mutus]|uniref:Uncharacterized protein n=1 Tax=Bos mutus TaxID=72004 RepID=A0A6B0SBW1_9CETA|nr:hypothetical protein [Bos mutus]
MVSAASGTCAGFGDGQPMYLPLECQSTATAHPTYTLEKVRKRALTLTTSQNFRPVLPTLNATFNPKSSMGFVVPAYEKMQTLFGPKNKPQRSARREPGCEARGPRERLLVDSPPPCCDNPPTALYPRSDPTGPRNGGGGGDGGRGVTAKPPVTAGDRASWPQKARSSSPSRQPRHWDPRLAAGGVCGLRRNPVPVSWSGRRTGALGRAPHPWAPSEVPAPAVAASAHCPSGRRGPSAAPSAAPGPLPALFPLCAAAFRPSPPAALHVLLTLSLRRPPRVQAVCRVRAAVVGPARSFWRLWDSAPGV